MFTLFAPRLSESTSSSSLQVTLTSKDFHLYLNIDMSDPPLGKQSKKSRLPRTFNDLFSRRSRIPSHQSVTPDNASASISALPTYSATSAPQVNPQGSRSASHQGTQSVTPHNASSRSTSPTNSATSAPQVDPQGTECTATAPSGSLTREYHMNQRGSTAIEGLKTAIQGINDCSDIFPPLQTTAGVLLTISKVVDVRGSVLYV